MIRVAVVDNMSALAYRATAPLLSARFVEAPPTGVYHSVVRGECDAALMPVARVKDSAQNFEVLGPYGIACRGPVYSVGYFGRIPLDELVNSPARAYLTGDSQTSRKLFQTLCRMEFGREPQITIDIRKAAGCLLIGDEALIAASSPQEWPFRVDLGEWWYAHTRLPFVFAIWVSRRDLPAHQRAEFHDWLDATAAAAESPIGRAGLAAKMAALGFSPVLAANYMDALHYRLGDDDEAAMCAFRDLGNRSRVCAANA